MTFAAVICGSDTLETIVEFAKAKKEYFKSFILEKRVPFARYL